MSRDAKVGLAIVFVFLFLFGTILVHRLSSGNGDQEEATEVAEHGEHGDAQGLADNQNQIDPPPKIIEAKEEPLEPSGRSIQGLPVTTPKQTKELGSSAPLEPAIPNGEELRLDLSPNPEDNSGTSEIDASEQPDPAGVLELVIDPEVPEPQESEPLAEPLAEPPAEAVDPQGPDNPFATTLEPERNPGSEDTEVQDDVELALPRERTPEENTYEGPGLNLEPIESDPNSEPIPSPGNDLLPAEIAEKPAPSMDEPPGPIELDLSGPGSPTVQQPGAEPVGNSEEILTPGEPSTPQQPRSGGGTGFRPIQRSPGAQSNPEPLTQMPVPRQPLQPQGSPWEPISRSDKIAAHTVQPGESYWVISKKYYGSGQYFKQLERFNRQHLGAIGKPASRVLRPGDTVQVPPISHFENRISPSTLGGVTAPRSSYKVRHGDTLSGISLRLLGSSRRWNELYELNKKILADPNHVKAGTILALPEIQTADRVLPDTPSRR